LTTLIDLYTLVYNTGEIFENRIIGAILNSSASILVEAVTVDKHTERLAWAKRVILDARSEAKRMKPVLFSNATIASSGSSCADSDLQWVVNQSVNLFL
jgi:hypothetical protein